MAQTGSFGPIFFEVSASRIKTWDNYRRRHVSTFAEHAVAEGKEKLEFTGHKLETVSFNIRLDASWVNPEKEIAALYDLKLTGEPQVLVIGTRPLGEYVLTTITERKTRTDADGRALVAIASLEFKEYN
ncbi:MAG: phage tail protein [Synergistales bacterium]|nr:phage tail protein [Synergistales bacterium]